MKKAQFGPRCTKTPTSYMKSNCEGEIEEEEQETRISQSVKTAQQQAVKPTFLKLIQRSSNEATKAPLQVSPVLSSRQPGERLVSLFNDYLEAKIYGVDWGYIFPDRLVQLETTFLATHKAVSKAVTHHTVGSQLAELIEQKLSLDKEIPSLGHSRGGSFYRELSSIFDVVLAQERISNKATCDINYDDLERSLQTKLDHKFNYLDRLNKNIEVIVVQSGREGKIIKLISYV